ncbi:MAG: S1C family serine protease [Solirubrobacterales bacterium]
MTRSRVGLVALAATAALITGCGSDTEEIGGSPAPDTIGDRARAIAGDFDAQGVYDRARPSVVTVIAVTGGQGDDRAGGLGSGFVLSAGGEIVTNAHVVTEGRRQVRKAANVYVDFADNNRVEAEIVGFDLDSDVALLKVDPEGLKLRALPVADKPRLKVGQAVAAIGSPFGEEQSLSVGVISALDRSVDSLTDFRIDGAIQTDAAINRGNSGGPLLTGDGQVIGINQQIRTSSGGGEGVGFAVPSDTVRRSVAALHADGRADYPYLGVSSQILYPQLAERLKLKTRVGALIAKAVDGGPAAKAGIRGGSKEFEFQGQQVVEGGDVVLAVEGTKIEKASDLSGAISARKVGDTVSVEVLRDGNRRTIDVKLDARPADVPDAR